MSGKIKIEQNQKGLYDITAFGKVVHTDRDVTFVRLWIDNQITEDIKSITFSI
jgi:uncharacterized protein YlbG (UPF0298 family)